MNRTEWAAWTVFAAVLAFTIAYAVAIDSDRAQEFREECVALGGKPVSNGKMRVCLR